MTDQYLEQVVHLGDDASRMLFEACMATWPNREGRYGEVNADHEHFRGKRNWNILPLLEVPEPEGLIFDQQADGIGTKVLVSQRSSTYDTAAFDLLAMACDDAAAHGMESVLATTVLDVNRLDGSLGQNMEQLARGGILAANKARIALYGGETAVLGSVVDGYGNPARNLHFSWSATVHAVGHRNRLIDGSAIRPGMSIVGLRETGLRSNGISKVRDTLKAEHGNYWHKKSFENEEGLTKLGNAVLKGSTIYTPVMQDAIGGYDLRTEGRARVQGAAHITGGGVTKLAELLATTGYGADIESPWTPPEIMKYVLRCAGLTDRQAYRIFHMGTGMAVVTDQPDKFISVAEDNDVEAKEIGTVTKLPGVKVRSAGVTAPGRKLAFAA